ncbi:MAG: c-type cytochrome, partial [Burkholderiales bacterium]
MWLSIGFGLNHLIDPAANPVELYPPMRNRIARSIALVVATITIAESLLAQNADPGRKAFESRCARCHGADGNGGEMGPAIIERLTARDDQQLADLIRQGLPDRGMPPAIVPDSEMGDLVKFLRTIERRPEAIPRARMTLQTTDGRTLDGEVLGEGFNDVQLLTGDKRVHLLRRTGDRFRVVTSQHDWTTYNGDPGGNRYTTLTQIDKTNVARLAPRWTFTVPDAGSLQVTPVVVDGLMYVTAVNE